MGDTDATLSPYLRQPLRSYAEVMRERRRRAGHPRQIDADEKPEPENPTRSGGDDGDTRE